MRRAILTLAFAGTVLAACATTVAEVGKEYEATLSGAAEVPGPGDPDGTGRANIDINHETNTLCADLEVRNITVPATAAHIHKGHAGEAGPPVVPLDAPDDDDSDNCKTISGELADQIKTDPTAFYVNVHTSDFPAGAIRGQLKR